MRYWDNTSNNNNGFIWKTTLTSKSYTHFSGQYTNFNSWVSLCRPQSHYTGKHVIVRSSYKVVCEL